MVLSVIERRLEPLYAGYVIRRLRPERAAIRFYGQYVGPNDVVVEAGAFRGYTTIGVLRDLCRLVYAFEPNPENFRDLSRVTKTFTRVVIFNVGLGDKTAVREMRGSGSGSTFLVRDELVVAKAQILPLDSIKLDPKPKVLIFDLEGYEIEAILGSTKTISQSVHSVLVEVHPLGTGGDTSVAIKALLEEVGGFKNIEVKETGSTWADGYRDRWLLATKRSC
jgi:FkbM family methyltransferase